MSNVYMRTPPKGVCEWMSRACVRMCVFVFGLVFSTIFSFIRTHTQNASFHFPPRGAGADDQLSEDVGNCVTFFATNADVEAR